MKQLRIFLTIITVTFLYGLSIAQIPNLNWATSFGDIGQDVAYGNIFDNRGNIYTVGNFEGTIDLDPGPNIANVTSKGSRDIYIQKLNRQGDFLWAKSVGGSGSDEGISITIDEQDNVIVTGNFEGIVDFDPGPTIDLISSAGRTDVFIVKLDSAGSYVWAKALGGPNTDNVKDIKTDVNGNIYTLGFFSGTADFNPGTGIYNVSSAGGTYDAFVNKLDKNGKYKWTIPTGGTSQDRGRALTIDHDQNIYCVGTFGGIVDFDPSILGIHNLNSSNGGTYIQKLDSNGYLLWAKNYAGSNLYKIRNDNVGNIYIIGAFTNTSDFDPGPNVANLVSNGSFDVYILKLASSGDYLWVRGFGGPGYDIGYSFALDKKNRIHSVGVFADSVDFDPSAGVAYHHSNGEADLFVQTLDSNGNYLYANTYGGPGYDYGRHISTSNFGDIYISGNFEDSVKFKFSFTDTAIISAGNSDVFQLKLSLCSTDSTTETIYSCQKFTWINGETYISSIDSISYTLQNCLGCDSIITLNLTITNTDTSISQNGASLMANQADANYQWLNCDSSFASIQGATSQTFNAINNGSYAIQISNGSCLDTSACRTVSTASLLKSTFKKEIMVYPNPTLNKLTISFGESHPKITARIKSINGVVLQANEYFTSSHFQLDILGTAGIYFLELENQDNEKEVIRIVKIE